MSRVFVVDGPLGVITNVSIKCDSNDVTTETVVSNILDQSSSGLNVQVENQEAAVEKNVAQSELDFTILFSEFFEEQPPLPPPRDYQETALFVAEPVHPGQSSDAGFFLAPEQEPLCQYDYYPFDQQEFEPVVRKGRGRPAGVKNKKKEVVKKEKRIRVVDINKTVFTYPQIIAMTLMNVKDEIATVQMFYAFAEHNFPDISASSSWKSTLRHALADNKYFEPVQNVISSAGRGYFWTFLPDRREELIQQIHRTINENEGSMEKLRMKNLDDLPLILNGFCPLPAEVMPIGMPVIKGEPENQREVFQQVTNFDYNVPQQFMAPYVLSDVAGPSNQPLPAHQLQWNPFGHQGYMQANQDNELVNNENNQYVQQAPQQYPAIQNIQQNPNYY